MLHQVLPVGPLQCNCSVFGDPATGAALVIDPGDDLDRIEALMEQMGLDHVERIVFTHAHLDHIGQGAEFKRRTGAPTYLHRLELPVLASLRQQASWMRMPAPEPVEIDEFLEEGDRFEFGGAEFQVLFTPGHSPGSISLFIPSLQRVIGGDVLFRGSIGRTDLPGGDHAALLRSIRDKLLPLDDAVVVYPGHGPETTIGAERRTNPFLRQAG
ncbi:MAG: MBL fold metallo-hydrolase [Acidobacteria bacterium]|nr:MBL fold metallo-hydrolase [Acidobacteriota bacterium]